MKTRNFSKEPQKPKALISEQTVKPLTYNEAEDRIDSIFHDLIYKHFKFKKEKDKTNSSKKKDNVFEKIVLKKNTTGLAHIVYFINLIELYSEEGFIESNLNINKLISKHFTWEKSSIKREEIEYAKSNFKKINQSMESFKGNAKKDTKLQEKCLPK